MTLLSSQISWVFCICFPFVEGFFFLIGKMILQTLIEFLATFVWLHEKRRCSDLQVTQCHTLLLLLAADTLIVALMMLAMYLIFDFFHCLFF